MEIPNHTPLSNQLRGFVSKIFQKRRWMSTVQTMVKLPCFVNAHRLLMIHTICDKYKYSCKLPLESSINHLKHCLAHAMYEKWRPWHIAKPWCIAKMLISTQLCIMLYFSILATHLIALLHVKALPRVLYEKWSARPGASYFIFS